MGHRDNNHTLKVNIEMFNAFMAAIQKKAGLDVSTNPVNKLAKQAKTIVAVSKKQVAIRLSSFNRLHWHLPFGYIAKQKNGNVIY